MSRIPCYLQDYPILFLAVRTQHPIETDTKSSRSAVLKQSNFISSRMSSASFPPSAPRTHAVDCYSAPSIHFSAPQSFTVPVAAISSSNRIG